MFDMGIDWFDETREFADLDCCPRYAGRCTQEPCISSWHCEQLRHISLEEFDEAVVTGVFRLNATIEGRKYSFDANIQPS